MERVLATERQGTGTGEAQEGPGEAQEEQPHPRDRYELWKVQKDSGEAVQITFAGGYRSCESPRGEHIYYTKFGQPGLFRMPAKGGEEQQVLSGNVGQFFAVTSTGVYFAPGGKEIQLFDSATGRTRTLAVLERGILGLAVSSDDAYIVWGQTDQFNQDLMLVEDFR